MIPVKEAVKLATDYGYDIFNKPGTIEEVEIDGKYWLITLSFEQPKKSADISDITRSPTILDMIGVKAEPAIEKSFKVFKIDGEDKQVISAKIRKL